MQLMKPYLKRNGYISENTGSRGRSGHLLIWSDLIMLSEIQLQELMKIFLLINILFIVELA